MGADFTPVNQSDSGLEVRTHFVRNRNALIAQADFGELYVDYYLHLADQQMRPSPAHDALFKRALAAFVLHSVSRPWNELTAWTINFQDPLVNVFLTGDNETGAVTGRVFDDNVRVLPQNLFFADVVRGTQPKRRSTIDFEGADPFVAIETFYAQSEQRGARFFQIGEESFALVIEHPDCDLAWFQALTVDDVRRIDEQETVVLMERRIQRWHCGCNHQRMLEVLAPTFRSDPDALFDGDPKLEMRCPRCGARHSVTREALEAFVAQP